MRIARLSLLLTAMALASLAPRSATALDAVSTTLPITTSTLANGMEVVVVQDHRAPVVTHMVWYRVGSADEEPGVSGIAHFLEHLLFKGTEYAAPGEFSEVVAANGGQENAFTAQDYTAYYQRVASDRLEILMRYEADRMRNLRLTDEDVLPEREVILEERASRIGARPGSRLNEQVNAALYLNHPYGRPVIGWEHEIRELDREDAVAFYNRYYTPANAILIVAGDADPDEVLRLARIHYEPIENTGVDLTPRSLAEPPQTAARRVIFEDPRAVPPNWRRLYLTPSYSSAESGEDAALALLSEVFGSGSTSRLYRALVVDQKIAVDAGAYYQGSQRDYGEFGIYATPAPGVTFDALEKAIEAIIADLKSGGVTEEELTRAKTQLLAETVYAQDSQTRMARNIGVALTTGSTIEEIKNWPKAIMDGSAEAVQKAAIDYLAAPRSVTGLLQLPATEAPNTDEGDRS